MTLPHRLFPPTLVFSYNSGFDDDISFTLGVSNLQPLYIAALETDILQRPKLTLLPARNRHTTPLAKVKSKGLKDSVITLTPPEGSGFPTVQEKLRTHYGLSSRTYSFDAPVSTGRRERFAWRRGGTGSMCSVKERRELVRADAGHEVVAVWSEGDALSMTKTGSFMFVGSGASGVLGPQWEIMAVVSVLRIWHEDYHAAKTIADALGGGG